MAIEFLDTLSIDSSSSASYIDASDNDELTAREIKAVVVFDFDGVLHKSSVTNHKSDSSCQNVDGVISKLKEDIIDKKNIKKMFKFLYNNRNNIALGFASHGNLPDYINHYMDALYPEDERTDEDKKIVAYITNESLVPRFFKKGFAPRFQDESDVEYVDWNEHKLHHIDGIKKSLGLRKDFPDNKILHIDDCNGNIDESMAAGHDTIHVTNLGRGFAEGVINWCKKELGLPVTKLEQVRKALFGFGTPAVDVPTKTVSEEELSLGR